MEFHGFEFFGREPSRLEKDLIRNPDFADIVERGRQAQQFNLVFRLPNCHCQHGAHCGVAVSALTYHPAMSPPMVIPQACVPTAPGKSIVVKLGPSARTFHVAPSAKLSATT